MMTLSRDAVVWAYRLILGRNPENEKVVQRKLESHTSIEQLRQEMLISPEFLGISANQEMHISSQKADIEVHVASRTLDRMFQRIAGEWGKLGEEEPYWSVKTSKRFLVENIDDNQESFTSSGEQVAKLIDYYCNRAERSVSSGTCLELGCGVGRVTQFLAPMFDKVVAIDISKGNLAVCNDRLKKAGVENVKTKLVTSPKDYSKFEVFDFLFSTIVLQHNPPPVQYFMLDQLLGRLADKGLCLFQIPVYISRYSFNAQTYLSTEPTGMEMHALPMKSVFELLEKHDCRPLEVVRDYQTGGQGSYTFFAEKRS